MKLLRFLCLLFAGAAFPQTWSGQSSYDARLVPPYRFCLGLDNGTDACLIQGEANTSNC